MYSDCVMSVTYTFSLDEKSQTILSLVKNKSEFVRSALESKALADGLIQPPSAFDANGRLIVTKEIDDAVEDAALQTQKQLEEKLRREREARIKPQLNSLIEERERAASAGNRALVKELNGKIKVLRNNG